MKVKDTLGLDFPNCPYLIDGELKITQSNAIMRYIAEKKGGNLDGGKDLKVRAKVSMLLEQVMDLRNTITRLSYSPDYKTLLPSWIENSQKPQFQLFTKFLANKVLFLVF